MKILNKSRKIIGIGKLDLLPGACETLPAEYEGNPIVQDYLKRGILEAVIPSKAKTGKGGARGKPPAKPEEEPEETNGDNQREDEPPSSGEQEKAASPEDLKC